MQQRSLQLAAGAPSRAALTRRVHRPLCALSQPDGAGRSARPLPNPPSAAASAAALLVSAALPQAPSQRSISEEERAEAYDAGFQAGLAAAQAQRAPAAPQHDSFLRSIVKAFSWRFFSTATTIALTITFFSASMDEALEMGAAEFVSKYVLFLIHERLWILVTVL